VNTNINSIFQNNNVIIPTGSTAGCRFMPGWKIVNNSFHSENDSTIYTVDLFSTTGATNIPQIIFDNNRVTGTNNSLAVRTYGSGVQISNNTIDGTVFEHLGANRSSQTNNIFRQSDRLAYAQDILRQIKPMPVAYADTLTPINGMLFYASNTNATFTSTGLWLFENGAWKKL
jgi:hypothetical protein